MQRRRLLAGVVAAGLAGCLDRDGSPGSPTGGTDGTGSPDGGAPTPTATAGPTPTAAGTATGVNEVVEQSLSSNAGDCGGEDTATVSFGEAATRVEGTITTPTPCYRLALDAQYRDPELSVTVAVGEAMDEPCAECEGFVTYAAEVRLRRGLPERVAVVHRHADGSEGTVARRERDGSGP